MDNIWRHGDKRNTMTLKGKLKRKTQRSSSKSLLPPPSKATAHIYDSNGKVNETRQTDDDAEMDGRNMMTFFFPHAFPLNSSASIVGRRPHGEIISVVILITSLGCNASREISASGIPQVHCID